MKKIKDFFSLLLAMMKVGLFTFGGGYAMISLLDREFVERRGWITSDEFLDLVTIAEATPGPIAINCATYIGYKRAGILGSVVATVGVCVPSVTIIYLISLFFNSFLTLTWVASAFRGIQVSVVFLILSAGVKMLKKAKKTPFNLTVIALTLVSMIITSLFAVKFSSILYVLIFGALGLGIYTVRFIAGGEGRK